ncbi:hypothetical protein [Natrinema pallidum]|uniref:Uncharacterized protein n=1 Tax=Natrinema pallidum TaxID=69527 RepID=A0A4P9TKG8_9EURY|nr:hypothetical protein [Natrinema pallidum]QCW04735.1 hypothetical protein FGF80_16570 [Natrinema pallidum]
MIQLLAFLGWNLNIASIILGAIIGIVIRAFLGPYVNSIATSIYIRLNAPKYEPPELDVEVVKESTVYPEGKPIDYYDGLIWDNEYSVYRFVVSNKGTRDIENLNIVIPLPGYSVYTNTDGESISGNYNISPLFVTRVQTTGDSCVSEKNCSYQIKKDKLAPDNALAVEFVVSQEFKKCDLLRAYSPRPEVSASFDWYINGNRESETEHFDLVKLRREYNNALYLIDNCTEGPSGKEIDRPYFIALVGIEDGDIDNAIEENCMNTDLTE